MEEITNIKISELCSKVCSGGTPKSSVPSYYDGNIPWLNTKEINFNRIYSTEKSITEDGLNNSSAKWIDKNAVIVAMYGATAGKTAISKIPLTTNQACCNLMIDADKADYRFVYYALVSEYNRLASLANGGAQQNLNAQQIKDFEIPFFSLKDQKRIANILSTLDDKIELNRRINDNLEQQAQTLFKSWLVDFDPFKNGKFVESEMGMIPEGWKVISLQEYCQEITRGNIPTYVEKSNRPILNQKVNKGVSLEKQYYKYNSENVEVSISKMAHYGDVLLNSLGQGTLGRVHLYKEKLGNVIIDQFITILRTNLFVKSAYLSYTLNRPEYQTIIEGNVTGSTGMWVLTINNVRNIKIIVPKESCFLELAPIINSIYQAISNNTAEMEQLCTLRDCILPHLMSGELKINDLNC